MTAVQLIYFGRSGLAKLGKCAESVSRFWRSEDHPCALALPCFTFRGMLLVAALGTLTDFCLVVFTLSLCKLVLGTKYYTCYTMWSLKVGGASSA